MRKCPTISPLLAVRKKKRIEHSRKNLLDNCFLNFGQKCVMETTVRNIKKKMRYSRPPNAREKGLLTSGTLDVAIPLTMGKNKKNRGL